MGVKRFHLDMEIVPYSIVDLSDGESYPIGDEGIFKTVVGLLNDQAETIRKQSIRIYCQDKEIQRLLGELEKIPKSIREVWLEE